MRLCDNLETGPKIIFEDFSDILCGLLEHKLDFYDDLYYNDDIEIKVNTIFDEWNK